MSWNANKDCGLIDCGVISGTKVDF